MRRRGVGSEGGFTLVELIGALLILGVIGAVLVEGVIVGLRTTEGSVARLSGSMATEHLASYFSADARSADSVVDPPDAQCATGDPARVFLRLRWTDTVTRVVEYTLTPPTGGEQDLERWACLEGEATRSRRRLGHFTRDPSYPLSVWARCDGEDCVPPKAPYPDEVTLFIRVDDSPAYELTIRRRA